MAFPSTSVLDNFTGTNGADLPVYSGNWSTFIYADDLDLEIQGNAATGTGLSSDHHNYWNVGNFGPAAEAFVTISTKPATSGYAGVYVRMANETNYEDMDSYYIGMVTNSGTDGIEYYRVDSGIFTQLGATISQEFTNGDSLGLEINGSTLTGYYKSGAGAWTALATRTDSTYSAAGKIGIECTDTTVRLDAFGGGTVVAAAAQVPKRYQMQALLAQ